MAGGRKGSRTPRAKTPRESKSTANKKASAKVARTPRDTPGTQTGGQFKHIPRVNDGL